MPTRGFSAEEVHDIKNAFPGINLVEFNKLQGNFHFVAQFNDRIIEDSYEITITAPDQYPNQIPLLREIGGKTSVIAKRNGIMDLRDLHFNERAGALRGTACLCVKQEEKKYFPSGSSVMTFIGNLVIPYFYGLSAFEKDGQWPWPTYSHGNLGILEYYARNTCKQTPDDIKFIAPQLADDIKNWKKYRDQLIQPSPRKLCPCASGKPFSICHALAWQGLLQLRSELKRLGMDMCRIFTKR